MERHHYRVILATNGEKALAQSHHSDLILMDVMFPFCSGLDICQKLRSQKKFCDTKIVLLIARGREIDVQKGMSVGADAYITKPFSNQELLKKVQDL